MKNAGELLASLGGLGGLTATYKYLTNKLAGKADQDDLEDVERRLTALEKDMAAMQQTLYGSDAEVDDGILVELQAKAEGNKDELKAIRRMLQELTHEMDTDTDDIKWRGGKKGKHATETDQ